MQDNKEVQGIEKSGEELKSPIKQGSRVDRFINAYIRNGKVGSQAVLEAGYKQKKNPSNTAVYLLNRDDVKQEIAIREAKYLQSIQMKKPDFLALVYRELEKSKTESTRARLLQLYGDVLGYTKKEESQSTTNIFQSIEGAKTFLNGFKDTIDVQGSVDTYNQLSGQEGGKECKQSIEETANPTTQMDATHMDAPISTLSGEVIDITQDLGGGGQG